MKVRFFPSKNAQACTAIWLLTYVCLLVIPACDPHHGRDVGQDQKSSQLANTVKDTPTQVTVRTQAPLVVPSPPSPMEPCADCHPEHVANFKRTGMGQSLYRPQSVEPIEHFGDVRARVIHPVTKVSYRAYIDPEGRWWQEESVSGSDYRRRVEVAYVIGSGNQTRSYLGWVENELIQMPLTWYSQKKKWDLSPGYERADHPRFDRKVQPPCLFCHNDLTPHRTGTIAQYMSPLAEGISCVRCHGDGEEHIALRQSGKGPDMGKADSSILNPARLNAARQLEICQQCHLAGVTRILEKGQRWDQYNPQTPLPDYMAIFGFQGDDGDDFGIAGHGQRLDMSRCATESPEPLTCTRCHDPHHVDKVRARRAACLECHQAEDCGSEHGIKPNSTCSECHMKRGETRDIPHVNFTDHYIRKFPKFGQQNIGEGRSHLLVDLLKGKPKDQSIVSQKFRRGLAHFEIWKARGGRLHLGMAERFLREGLSQSPDFPRAWESLGRTRLALGDYDGAIMAFTEVAKAKPHDLLYRFPYARALQKLGRREAAITVLQEGAVQAPESVRVWLRLTKALIRAQRPAEARQSIAKAQKMGPEGPEPWALLGQLELEEQNYAKAEDAFRRALELDPGDGRYHFNMAMTALSQGQGEKGRHHLEQSLAWSPHLASSYLILSKLSLESGDGGGARKYLREMMDATPKDPRSYIAFSELEASSGNINNARSILVRASQRLPANQEILDALRRLTPPTKR